jgi:hypothetical protein
VYGERTSTTGVGILKVMEPELAELAEKTGKALCTGDVDRYRDLLAPDAHWGVPDQPSCGCHSRSQIIDWYAESRRRGVTATVEEVVPGRGAILVGMTVGGTGEAGEGGGVPRRQYSA